MFNSLFNYKIDIQPDGLRFNRKWFVKSSFFKSYNSITKIELSYTVGFADGANFTFRDNTELYVSIRWRNTLDELIDKAKENQIKCIAHEHYHGGRTEVIVENKNGK